MQHDDLSEQQPEAVAEELVIFPMPSLVAVLLAREDAKGAPLTEAEVIEIRDGAECVAVPVSVIPALVEGRGYDDIDPERVWEEWQAIRKTLRP